MSLSIIDILFLVTVVLLVLNGWRNGALFSLIGLLVLPIGFAVVHYFGPTLTVTLASIALVQRNQAIHAAQTAQSDGLAAESEALDTPDPVTAALLASAAWPISPSRPSKTVRGR